MFSWLSKAERTSLKTECVRLTESRCGRTASRGKGVKMNKETLNNETLAKAATLCQRIGCTKDCPLEKEEASDCFASRRYCLQRVRYLDRYVAYLQKKT